MMKVGLIKEAARWLGLYALGLYALGLYALATAGCLATPAPDGSHAAEGASIDEHQRHEKSGSDESALSFVAGLPCTSSSDCGRRAFCQYPEGQCGGSGTCETRPRSCTKILAPVCGCDDQTYANACLAAGAGISVQDAGECGSPGPAGQSEGSDDGVPNVGQGRPMTP